MIPRRPALASARARPSSAIFIGLPPPPSPPSPARSASSTHSQLPSPPATTSGSTGDSNSTSAGSLRRTGMPNGNKHTAFSDDDDNVPDHDDDDTARLSNEKYPGKGKDADYRPSFSTLERVKSLTERNRKVIDKLSSITSPDSHSRSSPSAPSTSSSRSRSPLPPTFSSSSSSSTATTSSRVSFAPSQLGGSGSETEREQRHPDRLRPSSRDNRLHSSVMDLDTPLGPSRAQTPVIQRSEPRQRLRSAPSSPAKPPGAQTPNTPRKQTSSTFAVIGSGRRSRRVSIQQPDPEDEDLPAQPQTAGGSGSKKSRAPLPREFRDRRSFDGRSVGESSTSTQRTQDHERTISPGVLVARGAASPQSAGAGGTFSVTPTSPRAQRPARPSTLRDSSRRVQRWSSVDEVALNGNGNSPSRDDPDGRRQSRHAGSAESPLGGREGRSLVGEGLRAAGLARRGSEDVFAEGIPQRRTRLSGGLGSRPSLNGSRDGDLDELRRGIAQVAIGLPDEEQDPRTPPSTSGSVRYGAARNIHSVLSSGASRAGTSLGSYGADEEGPRMTPLRTYRSSYALPERTMSRHTPQHERSRTSPYGRAPQTPSSEHARLMLDSLTMFETQLARIPTSSSAPDLTRIAHSVVQSANGLNTLLRAGNAHALEAQIEAEVGDAATHVDASEVWRQVGGEYRESVRVSDELVRTVTALLLGVGRLVREAVKERGTDSPDLGGGGGGSGRSSLDGEDRPARTGRKSANVDGRRSTEGLVYREARRSWEDTEASARRMAARVEPNSRPSTSQSLTRDRERDGGRGLPREDGEETARENERSSALDRLSIRRMFTPRVVNASPASQDSPDPNYPSPSPASRTFLDRDRDLTSVDRDHDLRDRHRNLPPLTVPPPLPSLPSESLDRRGSNRRRGKFSNTSNATVRGTAIFPPVPSSGATTAVSAHTVSAAGEVTAFPLVKGEASPGSALVGLQEQQERDVRKRSLSITGESGDGDTARLPNMRVLRSSRVRNSLDGGAQEGQEHPPPPVNGERRERRRTINDLPS
ncbi:hypothetical protein JB92DRAFT_3104165 [Gautieria morchelliformis]|nr:hypothetical protein JB92DRAFT_3104165 [Gautieria morchelliformis]